MKRSEWEIFVARRLDCGALLRVEPRIESITPPFWVTCEMEQTITEVIIVESTTMDRDLC